MSSRGVAGLIMTLILPPVGLFYLWRNGVFRARGRMLLTMLATVEMALVAVWLTPHAELMPQMPVPAAPVQVTAAPEDDTLTALSNIERFTGSFNCYSKIYYFYCSF